MSAVTPAVRFAAHELATRLETPEARWTASRPSLVEAFPRSYPAGLVERAEALLVRMAAVGDGDAGTKDRSLWTDLVAFSADVEAAR